MQNTGISEISEIAEMEFVEFLSFSHGKRTVKLMVNGETHGETVD